MAYLLVHPDPDQIIDQVPEVDLLKKHDSIVLLFLGFLLLAYTQFSSSSPSTLSNSLVLFVIRV